MELAPALAEVSHPGEALAHEAIALLWGGDERRITEIVDLDYRDHAASGLDRGPQSVLAERHALRDAFADVEVRTEELILTGEHAVARLLIRGLHVGPYARLEPRGQSLEWEEIHIWRLEAGRLIEHWACRDDLASLCRVGAMISWREHSTQGKERRT